MLLNLAHYIFRNSAHVAPKIEQTQIMIPFIKMENFPEIAENWKTWQLIDSILLEHSIVSEPLF